MTSEFYKWLDDVNHELQIVTGLSIDEIGEYHWYEWYNEHYSPLEALDGFFSEEMV